MDSEEKAIRDNAIAFAKANKKQITRRLTNPEIYPPEDDPVSVFMAGSPGAGKTEASIALVNLFADTPILRIDPDELRSEFQDYVGGNAWLFQGPSRSWSIEFWIPHWSRSSRCCSTERWRTRS